MQKNGQWYPWWELLGGVRKEEGTLILAQWLRKTSIWEQQLRLKWKNKVEYFSHLSAIVKCSLKQNALFGYWSTYYSIDCYKNNSFVKHPQNHLYLPRILCTSPADLQPNLTFVIPVLYIQCNVVFLLSFQDVSIAHCNTHTVHNLWRSAVNSPLRSSV